MDQGDTAKIKELVDGAKTIIIATHRQPTIDSMGSSLTAFLGLSSLGKSVSVVCPDPMTVEFSSFVGADKMTMAVGQRNFVISLDYHEGSIEKVSYNIEGDKFNLVVEPRPGFEGQFSENNVSYTRSGASADLIFVIDTPNLGELGELYEKNKELFAGKPVVVIDSHANNNRFGQVNVVDPQAGTTAELVAVTLSGLGVRLTEDIATNILNAIYGATDSFRSPSVTPRTFEVASVCLKAGGKRFPDMGIGREPQKVADRNVTKAEMAPAQPKISTSPAPPQPVARPNDPVQTMPQPPQQQSRPQTAPEEWLKPKIFKSSQPVSKV